MHRLYILFGVRLMSRFMETSTMTHFKVLKRILWYIKGTIDFDLFYGYSNSFELEVIMIVIGLEIWTIKRALRVLLYI
jgi:hypothetical protein